MIYDYYQVSAGGTTVYTVHIQSIVCGVTRGEHAKYGCNTGNTLQNVVQYNYDIITSQCIKNKKIKKIPNKDEKKSRQKELKQTIKNTLSV